MNDYLVTKELYHWGIKGQKWGIRRYQNEDGTLTEAGMKRYKDNPQLKEIDDIKINRERNLKKAYDSFMKDMAEFKRSGRENDAKAIIERSKLYDSQVAQIKDQYKTQIAKAKIFCKQRSNFIKKHKKYCKQIREQSKKQLDKFNEADPVEKKKIIEKIKDRVASIYVGEHYIDGDDLANAFIKNPKYYKESEYYDYDGHGPDRFFRDFNKFVRETVSIYDMILQFPSKAGLKDLKSLADDPKITEEKFIKKYLENIYETSLIEPEKITTYLDMFEY